MMQVKAALIGRALAVGKDPATVSDEWESAG